MLYGKCYKLWYFCSYHLKVLCIHFLYMVLEHLHCYSNQLGRIWCASCFAGSRILNFTLPNNVDWKNWNWSFNNWNECWWIPIRDLTARIRNHRAFFFLGEKYDLTICIGLFVWTRAISRVGLECYLPVGVNLSLLVWNLMYITEYELWINILLMENLIFFIFHSSLSKDTLFLYTYYRLA